MYTKQHETSDLDFHVLLAWLLCYMSLATHSTTSKHISHTKVGCTKLTTKILMLVLLPAFRHRHGGQLLMITEICCTCLPKSLWTPNNCVRVSLLTGAPVGAGEGVPEGGV